MEPTEPNSAPQLDEFVKLCEKSIPEYHQFIEAMAQGLKDLNESHGLAQAESAAALASALVAAKNSGDVIQALKAEVEAAQTKQAQLEAVISAAAVASVETETSLEVNESTVSSVPQPQKKSPARKMVKSTEPLKKILILEGTEINRVLLGHYFKGMPAELEFSASGEETIQKCKDQKFDLVILDLQIKGLSAFEVTQALRDLDSKVFILALTQLENESEKELVHQAGGNAYLDRPQMKDLLLDKISAVFA